MAKFDGKFDSAKQEWETPQSLFDEVNREFNFTLDAAADSTNHKCSLYFTKEDDGLVKDWGSNVVWLNPPYGAKSHKLSDWVKKSYESSLNGATVVMLIPARTNTEWFHKYCLERGEVRFVRGRPRFGGATHGLPQPLCFVIFRPNRDAQLLSASQKSRGAWMPIEITEEMITRGACAIYHFHSFDDEPPKNMDDWHDSAIDSYVGSAKACLAAALKPLPAAPSVEGE